MIDVETIRGPAHWASYLVNGDASSFDYYNTPTRDDGTQDMLACDAWIADLAKDGWYIVSCEGEPEFARIRINGKPFTCDVVTYIMHRSVK